MLGKLRGFIKYFQIGINILAINYMQCKAERKQNGDDEFTMESAIRSVLAEFRLNSIYIDYITSQILIASHKVKGNIENSDFDLSFYENGFRFYSFEDDVVHDMQSKIMMCSFQTTPEKILLRFCEKAKVIGISATATVPTIIGNYDLDYLKSKMQTAFLLPSEADKTRLRSDFSNSLCGYDNVSINVGLLGGNVRDNYSASAWKIVFDSDEISEMIFDRIERELPDIKDNYHKERYIRIALAYKQFVMHNDIQSFLCVLTKHPSKMGILTTVLENFNDRFSSIAHLDFESITDYKALDYTRSVANENKQAISDLLSIKPIKIVDCIDDEYSKIFCKEICDLLLSKYGIKTSCGKRVAKDHLNIRVIHNAAFYADSDDPHRIFNDVAVQHITFEDFSECSEFAISTVIHEMLIKADLVKQKISLFDWNTLGLKDDIDFGIVVTDEQNTKYIFMTIHPDGTFNISEQTLNLFEANKYNQCVEIFENAKMNSVKVHGIIRDALGNINIIKDTEWFTIPEIYSIKAELANGNTKLRGKEKRNELLPSCLDIKMFNEGVSEYYFVGTIGNGMRWLINRAANIRKIEPFEDSILMFEKLLPLMNVTFVHNGQLTIIPFPFKYLREHLNK